ncbi:MAG TPA: alkaline phosphatase PhoX [Flavobacterium sp.]|jgi:hypothetical protein
MKTKLFFLLLSLLFSFNNSMSAQTNSGNRVLAPTAYPLLKDSQWSYLDNGTSLDALPWSQLLFDNQNWQVGNAPLGYGDPMNTIVASGPSTSRYITTYFTKDIIINLNDVADAVQFGLRRDDGAVVYVNGVELFRDNMPTGPINYLTNSSTTIEGASEKLYYTLEFPKSIFRQGVNRISVEVHNRDNRSSDLGFDLYIKDVVPALNVSCDQPHIGCFTSIPPTSPTNKMTIPQAHRFQMLFKQGEAYTTGTGNVPGMHDFTAFVPSANSESGYLSVNHENTPGGVSIIDLHFDEQQLLWIKDATQAVNMYNRDLVTTSRNCSGGITPWGTVITAEEDTASGDTNGDGYQDRGWLVEIDPVTKQVKEYGNGKQEKLWALGRMNHENIVVANDNRTAYYGEDGGTNCVYKFVADTPGNLSSGTVYVLRLDLPLSDDEPSSSTARWIQVPNATAQDRNTLATAARDLGGTNFNGVEDCEISPIDGKIYFTSKGKNRVYSFKDNGATVSEFETFVGGMSYPITTATGSVMTPWGSGNDNLTFDDKGNLWVLQDQTSGINYMWVVRPNHTQNNPQVLLFGSMPAGSEPTGLTFSPDYKYGFYSVQHPNSNNSPQQDATFTDVRFNVSATVVFALSENLGMQAPQTNFVADTEVIARGGMVIFTDLSTNNPSSRSWTFEGGTPATSTAASPTVTYPVAGTYSVTLATSNVAGGSQVSRTNYILVEETLNTDNTANTLGNRVKIYPNPTKGEVVLEFNEAAGQDITIEVVDFLGRIICSVSKIQSTGSNQKVDLNLSNLSANQVVLVKITVGSKTGTYKVIKVN